MSSGIITNIQKYSVQDGPGIRTTVFFKGCPLHCSWCHNPECITPQPKVILMGMRCRQCGECAKVCPQHAISTTAGEGRRCIACGACVSACPSEARQMMGRTMTVDEVFRELIKDELFYDDSNGGVTFSGGEPFNQAGFLLSLLKRCQARGIHTTVDTCGLTSWDAIQAAVPLTNLFLYDLKLMDEKRHMATTGAGNHRILENLTRLGNHHNNIWIRVPVIPGINDHEENWIETARYVVSIKGVTQVSLLPYHNTARDKYQRLGLTYTLGDITPPLPDRMQAAYKIFTSQGLKTIIGA